MGDSDSANGHQPGLVAGLIAEVGAGGGGVGWLQMKPISLAAWAILRTQIINSLPFCSGVGGGLWNIGFTSGEKEAIGELPQKRKIRGMKFASGRGREYMGQDVSLL